jgi:hypothetical protein
MAFILEHPDSEDPLEFESREAVTDWARAELQFWTGLGISGIHSADQYARGAQTDLQRLVDVTANANNSNDVIEERLRTSGFKFFLSTGARGQVLETLRVLGHDKRTITVALTALLHKEDELRNLLHNNHWSYNCVAGIAHVATFEAGGDPQRLVILLQSLTEYKKEWNSALDVARASTQHNQEAHDTAVAKLNDNLEKAAKSLAETTAKYESELTQIRQKFEEQFALRTPMTYWTEKAVRHREEARRYRRWFSGLLIGGVAVLAGVAALALFPFLASHPTAYWALILFSIAIAVLAWPMRMTSKQYLVHQQLFEDATERAVIAKTFLALGDQVKLTDADRQILLGSLMRPASISLASDDGGLNLADLVMAKTLTKS